MTNDSKSLPSDSNFYAACLHALIVVLVPPTSHELDWPGAEKSARTVVRALDSGTFPEGFVLPRLRAFFDRHREADISAGLSSRAHPGAVDGRGQAITVPTHSGFRSEAERAAAAVREAALPPLPTRTELEKDNTAALELFRDVSPAVRASAAQATILRLAMNPNITGAREADALAVAATELERAIAIFREHSIPIRTADAEIAALGEDAPHPDIIDTVINTVPYPGSLGLAFALQMLGNHEARLHNDDNDEPPAIMAGTVEPEPRAEVEPSKVVTPEARAEVEPSKVVTPEPAIVQTDDLTHKLIRIKQLADAGLISAEDAATARRKALGLS